MSRLLPWLPTASWYVDRLINIGHQVVDASLSHVCSGWGNSSFIPSQYNLLLPHTHLWPLCFQANAMPPRPCLVSFSLNMLEASARPKAVMGTKELVTWWKSTALSCMQKEPAQEFRIDQPQSLIKAGVALLRDRFASVMEDSEELGACLCMVGTGAASIMVATQCECCGLRRSVFGTKRCIHCNRSKHVLDPNEDNAGAARARRSRAIRPQIAPELEISSPETSDYLTRAISSILFSMDVASSSYIHWSGNVDEALRSAPLVTAKLPQDFSDRGFEGKLEALRASIDQHEWDYGCWPAKISFAQAWYDGESKLETSRKGPGPANSTVARASQARTLLKSGLSKGETAQRLGISASNLSHILRRTASVGT